MYYKVKGLTNTNQKKFIMTITDDFFKSEEWKKYEDIENEKKKSIKTGPNVIHLEYLSPLIHEKDINEYEKKVESVGLRLSHYDKNGTMYACLDTFDLVIFFQIAPPLIIEIIKGIASSASWDIIKLTLLSTWRKVRKQSFTRLSGGVLEKREITFGLKVNLDKNTSINLKLDGNVDESIISKSLDQVLEFLKEQKLNEQYKTTDYAYFDTEKNQWIKIDVEQALRKEMQDRQLGEK